jgi:nucleoid DNA-binding protein
MSQEELIAAVSERAGLSRQTVQEIVEEIGRIWSEALLRDGELSIENVGEFLIDYRPGRRVVDIDAREIIIAPPYDCIVFAPSPELSAWSNRPA